MIRGRYIQSRNKSLFCKDKHFPSSIAYFSTTSTSSSGESKNKTKTQTFINNNNEDPYHGYKLSVKQKRALKLINDQYKEQINNIEDQNESLSSSINNQTDLTQVLKALRQQAEQQDLEHYQANPQPWYNLLTFPSRALWRSSPKLPSPYLTNTQFDLLKKSERTSKQLRRTIENIVKSHIVLAERREIERRNMVNANSKVTGAKTSLQAKKLKAIENQAKPVYYKPEQTLSSLKYRLVPNYNIMKRILRETQSLLGKDIFQPKKVLDVGIGVGSASAAVLDFAYERFMSEHSEYDDSDNNINRRAVDTYDGVEWIHGIDPSLSMRDGAERILTSVINGQQEELRMNTSMDFSTPIKHPRITLGETLSSTVDRDVLKSKGTFDLVISSFTLCEIPNVAASLALVAMMWEKLSPGGVAIFIEPGTPDGFNSLRSARSMLLDCCPPSSQDSVFSEYSLGDEECHVIAPCTHNGTCPMIRHKRFFVKTKDNVAEDAFVSEDEGDFDEDWEGENFSDIDEEEVDFDDGDGYGEGEGEEDGWEDIEELGDDEDWNNYMNSNLLQELPLSSKSIINDTDVFDSSFCSFIHGMPGGEHGKRGEKFSYLVVQKRIRGQEMQLDKTDQFRDVDIVELLSKSISASGMNSKTPMKQVNPKAKDNPKMDPYLMQATDLERTFVDSDEDKLGLELVKGKLDSWGRIVRAPIKKKGHVIVDFCTSSSSEDNEDIGKIVRQKVTRSHSERAAPGMYLASRKSRWGGLWPNVRRFDKAS